MANNKANFLKVLLNQSNLSNEQLGRINELLGSADNYTTGRIRATPKHKPYETYQFLTHFSAKDGGLKNLTHSFNGDIIEHQAFIDKCKSEYEEALKDKHFIPIPLLARIQQFAFSEKPNWYIRKSNKASENEHINTGWCSPKFIKWYKENKKHPCDDPDWNSQMIEPFKESIEVRTDKTTGTLKRILLNIAENKEFDNLEIIIEDNIEKAKFFTDVDLLTLALNHIISLCSKIAARNFQTKVIFKYEYLEEEGKKKLYIIHVGSFTKDNPNDSDFVGGDLHQIKNDLTNLCNYEIETIFENRKYKRFLLFDKSVEKICKKLDDNYKIEGFTHILTFY